jgi:hypothetical protein
MSIAIYKSGCLVSLRTSAVAHYCKYNGGLACGYFSVEQLVLGYYDVCWYGHGYSKSEMYVGVVSSTIVVVGLAPSVKVFI